MTDATDARPVLHRSPFADLTPAQLYAVLRLRSEIFVVEQEGVYQDLDDHDADAAMIHLWHEAGGQIVSVARMFETTDDAGRPVGRIGRIGTSKAARGPGLARELVQAAIDHFAPKPVILAAQSYLEAYYASFGFVVDGERFDEHGIAHTPMRRD
ncbi:MAG: GNAT family N-acetyltransferase [Solirubrobacteraceae bacterium]